MLDPETTNLNSLPGVDKDKLKRVDIYLKHGTMIPVSCTDCVIHDLDGVITGYEFYGLENNYPLYLDTREIAAIIYVK